MKLIAYLMKNLGYNLGAFQKEWSPLSEKDKNDLRQYARDEMTFLGIAIIE